jgi:PPOX class probable F420-dependent enzyme
MNAGVTSNPKNVNNLLNEPMAKFFKGRNFAFVATINKDGSPQVTPTWIDIEKEENVENDGGSNGIIVINTVEGRIKHKNVLRDPRVSISLTDGNNPYSMVTIKGKVIEEVTRGADEHIDKLAKRYLNIERYPGHSSSMKRVILKIKPEKIFYLPPRYTEYLERLEK